MEILRMDGIGKSFGGGPVLENVAWDLRSGEVHILAGENGAGKTTLIKILAGVHTQYAGEIRLEGRTVKFRSPHDAARQGISAIHQDTSLVLSMNVVDNIFLGREILSRAPGMDFGAQRRKARELLGRLGLDIALSEPLGDFPVSVRQRVEIAKALVYEARIIIMDEPTSALNETETAKLFEIIRSLRDRGCAIVFISHRLDEIYQVADRITVLRDGRNVGTAAAVDLPPDRLVAWMVGREIDQQFPTRQPGRGKPLFKVRDFSLPDAAGLKTWAVEGVSFDLHEGEIVGFAGLQGSGKSELFHGLFGAFGPVGRGRVELGGTVFVPRSPAESIRRGLALMTNDRKGSGLVSGLSVTRNISLASLPAFSPGGWIRESMENAAAERDVRAFDIRVRSIDQEVGTLSGGNQQKVVFAKWLETRPKVLLLDEPTIGVDVGAKHEIYRLMNRWTSEGKGILLITSELPELLAMSDRIMVMHRGRILSAIDRADATQERVVRAALGKEANA
ncbi:MAG: sugar ABC transporter ATP-binding protein [Candidatus Aminicenantes bacterium]|nr:sugar ABC transporter ATP-binding protein [Candidatus Aminicenantes bacterium]